MQRGVARAIVGESTLGDEVLGSIYRCGSFEMDFSATTASGAAYVSASADTAGIRVIGVTY